MDDYMDEELRTQTVEVVLELRRIYLRSGANALKHWEQITTRLRSATRRTSTVSAWATAMMKGLALGGPDRSLSSDIVRLERLARRVGERTWIRQLEDEHTLIIAEAQLEAERRRDEAADAAQDRKARKAAEDEAERVIAESMGDDEELVQGA
jgi:hypothetical protein